MLKSFVAIGIALVVIGAAALLLFVVPQFGADYGPALPPDTPSVAGPGFAAVLGGLALAGGAVLIGIGVGRWKRPRPSGTDGTPEV